MSGFAAEIGAVIDPDKPRADWRDARIAVAGQDVTVLRRWAEMTRVESITADTVAELRRVTVYSTPKTPQAERLQDALMLAWGAVSVAEREGVEVWFKVEGNRLADRLEARRALKAANDVWASS